MVEDTLVNTALNTGLAVAIALYLIKFVTDRVFNLLSDKILTKIEEITKTQEMIVHTQREIVEELRNITETQKEIILRLESYSTRVDER